MPGLCGARARAGAGLPLLRLPVRRLPDARSTAGASPAARAARLPQLIRGWGVELPADEDVTFFGYCRLDSADGYLLVTARRLMFFAASGGRKLLEWPLEQVAGVAVAGRWGRSWLHLRGPGPDVALHHFANRHALAELAGHLRAPVSPS